MWEVQKGAMIETPDLKQSTSNLWKKPHPCVSPCTSFSSETRIEHAPQLVSASMKISLDSTSGAEVAQRVQVIEPIMVFKKWVFGQNRG